ncbi:hypothetical protein [Fluviispira multicolorata]|uniref:Uncharacterized protein n=1 Tax=Fluviispira multicolorata TaxID=2654512 RepID=A0A833JAY4_9BACT|nr:hypothetical protein [Fluviispira multicolorata]KAB8027990.1 hypothetical protein GCL57_13120 [Fluviispira multicolorata]
MNQEKEQNIEKQIKKHIYGKSQTAIATFPAGFSLTALQEIEEILNNLWFKQKFNSKCTLLKNEILIENVHVFALTEILMRSLCLTDLRLILLEEKAVGKEAFTKQCQSISWDYYLNKSMSLKVKVDSVASKAFHESGLKEILSNILNDKCCEIVSGENTNETTALYAHLYKDKLTVSISLAGNPLYKRGYRGTLSASAPLREDAAACTITKAFEFLKKHNPELKAQILMLPFSGTGTFAFEYLLSQFAHAPSLLNREYAIQKMPLFRKENFSFLLKKANEFSKINLLNSAENPFRILSIDNSKQANTAFLENIENFKNKLNTSLQDLFINSFHKHNNSNENILCENFLKLNIDEILNNANFGNVFLPLNPPYGIRLNDKGDSTVFYSNVGKKVSEIGAKLKNNNTHLFGFILCPNEDSWSAFCKCMRGAEIETYHFTQGGMDIRVCMFFNK